MKKRGGKKAKEGTVADDGAAAALALFASDAQGIAIVDQGGRIVRANPRLARLFGYDDGELVGQSVEMLIPERLRTAHTSHRDDYFKSPRTRPMGIGLDLVGRRKDGKEFPVDVSLSSFQSGDEPLVMAFITEIHWDPI